MRHFYKDCKNMKQVNSYLRKIGLGDFELDVDPLFAFNGGNEEFDFDGWINDEETKGVSVLVTTGYEVFASKYTRKDIEKLNAELIAE